MAASPARTRRRPSRPPTPSPVQIRRPSRPRPGLSVAETEEAVRRYRAGQSIIVIAENLERRKETVSAVLKQQGFPIRVKFSSHKQAIVPDPAMTDRPYEDDESEFLEAVRDYQTRTGRKFPSFTEVFAVVKQLGYHR